MLLLVVIIVIMIKEFGCNSGYINVTGSGRKSEVPAQEIHATRTAENHQERTGN